MRYLHYVALFCAMWVRGDNLACFRNEDPCTATVGTKLIGRNTRIPTGVIAFNEVDDQMSSIQELPLSCLFIRKHIISTWSAHEHSEMLSAQSQQPTQITLKQPVEVICIILRQQAYLQCECISGGGADNGECATLPSWGESTRNYL